jgi:hypothetical protein
MALDLEEARQGSAAGISPATDKIEITPAMTAAGRDVLYRMTTHIADEEYWADEIYLAMSAARHRTD